MSDLPRLVHRDFVLSTFFRPINGYLLYPRADPHFVVVFEHLVNLPWELVFICIICYCLRNFYVIWHGLVSQSASLLESRRQADYNNDNVDDANEATANPKPTITQIGRFVGLQECIA